MPGDCSDDEVNTGKFFWCDSVVNGVQQLVHRFLAWTICGALLMEGALLQHYKWLLVGASLNM